MSPPAALIHAAGAGALALVLGAGYVLGLHSRIEARRDTATIRTEIASLEREARAQWAISGEAAARIEQIESAVEAGRVLRLSSERNATLAAIAQIATDHGLKIDELAPGATEDDGGRIVSTLIRLRARAGVASALGAIEEVHRAMAGLEVRSLEITADPFSDRPGSVSIDFVWHADRGE